MSLAARFDNRDAWRSPLLSLGLHLAAGAALVFVPLTQQRFFQPPEPVPVEIVPLRQFFETSMKPTKPVQAPPVVARRAEGPPSEASIPRAKPWPPAADDSRPTPMVRPQEMLSAAALANPRSRKARQQLRTLAADERSIQLCNIEAMEQVHAWKATFAPETVVPYALQDLRIEGHSIVADGAAFYSARSWYRLRFECGVQEERVVAFAFSVGDPVPRADWEAHNLSEQADDDDD